MDDSSKQLLSEYMNVLYRITVACHWFNNEGMKHGKGTKEHMDFCNLLYRMRDMYIELRERNINPPVWINDKSDVDKMIKEYKEMR